MSIDTLIIDEGRHITIDLLDLSKRIDKVPAMVYHIRMTADGRSVLAKSRDKFVVPKKRFGKHELYKKEILARYLECKDSMGALFNGLKGAGKSMLAEDLCNEVIKMGYPIIHIDSELPPSLIRKYMKFIGPCALYFDEFGKYYKEEQRNGMLTFFSDTSHEKVLFLVTSNTTMELNDFMIDRPSRFLFRINFDGVDAELMTEIIEDWKLEPTISEYLIEYCKVHRVSFDVINAISRPAMDSRTVKEFADKLKVLNVPQAIFPRIRVRSVIYNGEPWKGDYKVDEENGKLSIQLFKLGEVEAEYSGEVEWLTAKKIMLSTGVYNVEFDAALTVKLNRSFAPYKFAAERESPDYDSEEKGPRRRGGYLGDGHMPPPMISPFTNGG
jgi:adenylate kinase family enzyme